MRSAKFSHSSDLFVSARFKTSVFAINTRDTNMRPKKRDQQVVEEPKSQVDQAQADHELFLQAFESKHVYLFSCFICRLALHCSAGSGTAASLSIMICFQDGFVDGVHCMLLTFC